MSVTIKYKGNTIASASTDTTKTIKTSGKYCEADIEVINTQDGGITPSGSLSITENGTYDVTQYASADVNVSGGTIENGLIFTELNANGEPLSADFYGEYIGEYMFGSNVGIAYHYNLETLKTLSAKNVVTVSDNGFLQTKLRDITIAESCTHIGWNAFRSNGDGADITVKILGSPTFENYVFYQNYKLKTCQLGSVGYPITSIPDGSFVGDTRNDLEITVYSTQVAYTSVLANIRNGATNATIIVKDSTTGEVIVTSTP